MVLSTKRNDDEGGVDCLRGDEMSVIKITIKKDVG